MKLSFEEIEELLSLLPFVAVELWGNSGHVLQERAKKLSKTIEDRRLSNSSTGEA
jgi:hypothetical protein